VHSDTAEQISLKARQDPMAQTVAKHVVVAMNTGFNAAGCEEEEAGNLYCPPM
jgi:hypothetical protein